MKSTLTESLHLDKGVGLQAKTEEEYQNIIRKLRSHVHRLIEDNHRTLDYVLRRLQIYDRLFMGELCYLEADRFLKRDTEKNINKKILKLVEKVKEDIEALSLGEEKRVV